jgi:SAM-dependent methyltransferase
MQSLYSNGFEYIFDAMYKKLINYSEEYIWYSNILKKYHKTSVLEIGCGSGNLANLFIKSKFNYTGLDASNDMIKLSQKKNPKGIFIQGNMTNFSLKEKMESILITGRTSSYLLNNKSLFKALKSINDNLVTGGVLCFDFIDATRFFPLIRNGKKIHHYANYNEEKYTRKSFMIPNKSLDNFMFDWKAIYFKEEKGVSTKIAEDNSTVRAFTKNEWSLFLKLSNFKVLEIIDRKSYAFDTYVIVAQKI